MLQPFLNEGASGTSPPGPDERACGPGSRWWSGRQSGSCAASGCPVPNGSTVPVSGPGRIGSSLHQPSGDHPEGLFDPLGGCRHTPTAHHRTYVLLPCDPSCSHVATSTPSSTDPSRPPPALARAGGHGRGGA